MGTSLLKMHDYVVCGPLLTITFAPLLWFMFISKLPEVKYHRGCVEKLMGHSGYTKYGKEVFHVAVFETEGV